MEYFNINVMKWWASIRWFLVIVLFAIGMLHLSNYRQTLPAYIFIGVFLGIVILNLIYRLNAKTPSTWVTSFQVVLDTVFATLVVHMTGGLNSYFVWIYLIGVITASIMIPQMGGLLAGLIGSVSLFSLVLLYQYDILAPLIPDHNDISSRTIYVLSYTALFCGVAMIANYINDQLTIDSGKVVKQNADIEQLSSRLIAAENELENLRLKQRQSLELLEISSDIAHIDHDLNTPLCIISLSIGRVKRIGMETNDEAMLKTSNEITEAINKINHILQRLIPLKTNTLIRNHEEGLTHE
jgi:signal transduction histidine kinase